MWTKNKGNKKSGKVFFYLIFFFFYFSLYILFKNFFIKPYKKISDRNCFLKRRSAVVHKTSVIYRAVLLNCFDTNPPEERNLGRISHSARLSHRG